MRGKFWGNKFLSGFVPESQFENLPSIVRPSRTGAHLTLVHIFTSLSRLGNRFLEMNSCPAPFYSQISWGWLLISRWCLLLDSSVHALSPSSRQTLPLHVTCFCCYLQYRASSIIHCPLLQPHWISSKHLHMVFPSKAFSASD